VPLIQEEVAKFKGIMELYFQIATNWNAVLKKPVTVIIDGSKVEIESIDQVSNNLRELYLEDLLAIWKQLKFDGSKMKEE